MAQLLVRNVDDKIVEMLKQRAATHGRSMEAELRAVLSEVLLSRQNVTGEFLKRSQELRERFKSPLDSADLIREDRDTR